MIKWTISSLEYDIQKSGKNNVVSKINYHAWDGDGDGMGQVFGRVQINTDVIEASEGVEYYDPLDNFIEWSDLTEDKCIEWVKESLGESGIKSVESKIEKIWLESKEQSTGNGKPF